MSENELGKALLRGEETIDIQALTRNVLRRDRRRIWLSGFACIIAWMLVVMLPWSTILPMLAKVVEHQAQFDKANQNVSTMPGESANIPPAVETRELLQVVKTGTIATFVGSVGSMFVAATMTVWFIAISRRATLRQVNARLAEISGQLKAIADNSNASSSLKNSPSAR